MSRRNGAPPSGGSDDEQESFSVRFGSEGRARPSIGVIESVAATTGTEPEGLRPLYETVDPDALDKLCLPVADDDVDESPIIVSFEYEGCDVRVRSNGRITVAPSAEE